MEESPQQGFSNPQPNLDEEQHEPSYWKSVSTAAIIFGIIAFALSLVSSYAVINSEPTGSWFSPVQLIGTLVCLVGAFGGMLASWHYAQEYDVFITLGKGTLIGFLTGVGISIVMVVLGQLWQFIDPDMTEKVIDSTIANIEAMDLPDAQKQQAIDATAQSSEGQDNIWSQLLWSIPMYGILNLITGMIGAKIFGQKEV
jgi:hypothetical protein